MRRAGISLEDFGATDFFSAVGLPKPRISLAYITEYSFMNPYPARWTVTVPTADLTLEIEPYLADQELNLSYDYWKGAVRVSGERAGSTVSGSGYVEMTGYVGSMQGWF